VARPGSAGSAGVPGVARAGSAGSAGVSGVAHLGSGSAVARPGSGPGSRESGVRSPGVDLAQGGGCGIVIQASEGRMWSDNSSRVRGVGELSDLLMVICAQITVGELSELLRVVCGQITLPE
jgi:hypothetical protein